MGEYFRGDPSSALLEVLASDPNYSFNDPFLEVAYDLSDVLFVTTSNTLNIPGPLMDRMEIIRLSGYTEEEKFEIARRHLIPETLKENGLEAKEFVLSDELLMRVVRDYTREAGVRNLKREISKLMRKSVRQIMQAKSKKVEITAELLEEYLGPPYYRNEKVDAEPQVGLVTGLAWTSVGGETLTIEAVMTHGKGRMTVTGNLKEVMKESIQAANGYVRSRAVELGIKPPLFDTRDIHVHVPEGATPKDGPSAGVGMATAIVSVMTGIPVRHDVAMTGEVTLRGRVLPIGGLKEKLLAALRFGIKTVLIPAENVRDLKEIPEIVTKGMEIVPVSNMSEVLSRALVRQPEPIEWTYDETPKVAPVVADLGIDVDEAGLIQH
jgi:ATP-dependent Lon protease